MPQKTGQPNNFKDRPMENTGVGVEQVVIRLHVFHIVLPLTTHEGHILPKLIK